MASVNKVILVGHLGADPEMRYLPNGDAVANLRLATTDNWKDKEGNKQEATEWHRISFFGRIAEVCGQYLKKGSQIYVEGSIKTRKYQDKDGQEKYFTEIRGDQMKMLGSAGGKRDDSVTPSAPPASKPQPSTTTTTSAGPFDDIDDDIPFLFNVCSVRDTMGMPTAYWRGRHGKGMSLSRANQSDF